MDKNKLIHLLCQTARAISQNLNQALTPYDLHSSEWSIIVSLKKLGPISQITLANYLNVEPAAISQSLARLEEKNFVTRKAGDNKREKKVLLTDSAVSQFPMWEKLADKKRDAVFADLSEEQLNDLSSMLQAIFTNSKK